MNPQTWIVAIACLLLAAAATAQYPDAEVGDIGQVRRLYLDDIVAGPDVKDGVELFVRAESRYGEPVETVRGVDLAIRDNGGEIDPETVELWPLFETDHGVSAVVVIDRGQRNQEHAAFARAKSALVKLIDGAAEKDSIAVVEFGRETTLVSPFGASGTELRAAVAGIQMEATGEAQSKLYDAVFTAVDQIRSSDAGPARGFVIAFTGGPDIGSGHTLEELIELGRGGEFEPRIPVFTVAYAPSSAGEATALHALSEGTAAKSFQATSPIHLPSLFDEIWRQMSRSYLVRYRTDLDGEMHKIEISVEGHSDMRMVTYPDVSAPIYGWLFAVLALAIAGAVGYRVRSRNRLIGRLVFVGGQEAGREVVLRGPDVHIGALPDNDVVVGSGAVSRNHAVIHLRGGSIEIEDLETRNGTFVNGAPVQTQLLQPGDKIRIADIDMVYEK